MPQLTNNFVLDSDAYKLTHWLMNKPQLKKAISYAECRLGSVFPATIFNGLQPQLMKHFEGPVIDKYKIAEGEDASGNYFGTRKYFNRQMWNHVLNKYGGHLPIRIKAVKEGSLVPISNILYEISSLDEKCIPIVQHSETLLMQVWYPITIATNAFFLKRELLKHLQLSGTPENIEYRAHNFGFRAGTCIEDSQIASLAWLINFRGDDTNSGDRAAKFYYGYEEGSILKSVMASEHSVALQYGPGEGEYEYVHACLDAAGPDNIVSIVIDTFDSDNFIDNVITRQDIKEKVMARKMPAVWRQDSGNPQEVTLRNLNSLSQSYGYNFLKGFKILPPQIALLQGDAMDRISGIELISTIENNKWSSDNLVIAAGSGFVKKNFERDTQRMAIKPSQYIMGDTVMNVQKIVKSQPDKASKAGQLKLHQTGKEFMTISSAKETRAQFEGYSDALQVVFENGVLANKQSFDDVRKTAKFYL